MLFCLFLSKQLYFIVLLIKWSLFVLKWIFSSLPPEEYSFISPLVFFLAYLGLWVIYIHLIFISASSIFFILLLFIFPYSPNLSCNSSKSSSCNFLYHSYSSDEIDQPETPVALPLWATICYLMLSNSWSAPMEWPFPLSTLICFRTVHMVNRSKGKFSEMGTVWHFEEFCAHLSCSMSVLGRKISFLKLQLFKVARIVPQLDCAVGHRGGCVF